MTGAGVRSLSFGKKFPHICKVFLHPPLEDSMCVAYVFLACGFAFCTVHHNLVSTYVVVVTAFGPFGPAVARQGLPVS